MANEVLVEDPLPAVVASRLILNGYDYPWRCSTMALQKLLYLAHGHHLAWFGAPLIDEEFTRWSSGPVALKLQAVHGGISNLEDCPEILKADTRGATEAQRATIESILHAWCGVSGPQLSGLTLGHSLVASTPENEIMSNEDVRSFFAKRVSGLDSLALDNRVADVDYRAQLLMDTLDDATRQAVIRSVMNSH